MKKQICVPRSAELLRRAFRFLLLLAVCAIQFAQAQASPFIVTNASDSGPGSLRQALATASDGDRIQFDPALNGQTITLTSGELLVDKSITIIGPGAGQLSVNGNAASRVFHIGSAKIVTVSGLTITNGAAPLPNRWGGEVYTLAP